jgi:hypothetical protein
MRWRACADRIGQRASIRRPNRGPWPQKFNLVRPTAAGLLARSSRVSMPAKRLRVTLTMVAEGDQPRIGRPGRTRRALGKQPLCAPVCSRNPEFASATVLGHVLIQQPATVRRGHGIHEAARQEVDRAATARRPTERHLRGRKPPRRIDRIDLARTRPVARIEDPRAPRAGDFASR